VDTWLTTLSTYILQAIQGDLKTASYPKEWSDLRTKVSFGMGAPARVPWIAFVAPGMEVSHGFYPVYLYYKDFQTLILAYGLSDTQISAQTWPADVMNSTQTIAAFFDKDVPRYGDSFVFKAYKIEVKDNVVTYIYIDSDQKATEQDINSDLSTILDYYKKVIGGESSVSTEVAQGLFYMEKQLEDFLISNWENTDLGKKYDLIIEEGVLLSQQYRTDIGPIDILAQDKQTNDYVVIELKKYQTSDDTIGQLARYMGWVKENKGGNVKGVIIAGVYDRKLDFALKVMPEVEVFLYQVDFKLNKFSHIKTK
jgi:hypothetical protein